jgi:hypothetical protein
LTRRVEERRSATWQELRRDLYSILFGSETFVDGRFLFRGLRDAEWKLVSSFDRFAQDLPLGERRGAAKKLLDHFKDECAADPALEPVPEDDDERIALAQHYGVPTRGLDWSASPFIAAYFAFADVRLDDGSDRGEAAIWALDLDDDAWDEEHGVRIIRPSIRANERLARQRGYLTYMRAPFAALEDYARQITTDGTALWTLRVPRREARVALSDLSAMGITGTRLFPDWTGAARTAKARFALQR